MKPKIIELKPKKTVVLRRQTLSHRLWKGRVTASSDDVSMTLSEFEAALAKLERDIQRLRAEVAGNRRDTEAVS